MLKEIQELAAWVKYELSTDARIRRDLEESGKTVPWGAFSISLIYHPNSIDFGYKYKDKDGRVITWQELLETKEELAPFQNVKIPKVHMDR